MEHIFTYLDVQKILSDIEKATILLRSNTLDNVDWSTPHSPKGKNNEYQELEWSFFEFLYKLSHQLTESSTEFFESARDILYSPYHKLSNNETSDKSQYDEKLRNNILKARVNLLNAIIHTIDRNRSAAKKHLQYCIASEQKQYDDENIKVEVKKVYQQYQNINALYPEKKNKVLESITITNSNTY